MLTFNRFFVLAVILALVILGNLAFLDYQLFSKKEVGKISQQEVKPEESFQFTPTPTVVATPSSSSLADFQVLVDQKLAKLKEELLKTLATPTPKPAAQPQTQPQPKEIFVNFGVNGSTTATSWTDLSGSNIIFDLASYPGVKAFYFQANLKSDAPDRETFARIYDATHGIGVQGSEISYAGLTSKLIESGSLTFWSGKLTLKVQIHNLNVNLATIENPRIRVVY